MNVVLVVPCYNEARRIRVADFKMARGIEFIFVNDGSTDETLQVLEGNKVLNLEQNQGKAEAVRLGMLQAYKDFPGAQWIGYWDADLATPLNQCQYMLSFEKINPGSHFAIWGSRLLRLGARISRSSLRHFLGRLFVTYSSIMLNTHAYDSQCGAKLFKRELVPEIFEEKFITSWLFDLEILMRMRKMNRGILECPLQEWEDVKGSKLGLFTVGLRAFGEVIKIRKKYDASP